MMGSVVDACTSATMLAESEIDVISQPAPTPWIRPPRLEAMLASQIDRKVRYRNGASVAGRSEVDLSIRRSVHPQSRIQCRSLTFHLFQRLRTENS